MRGKVQKYIHFYHNARITPAHAGKSAFVKRVFIKQQDHPRTCGEKIHHISATILSIGITPAHAGKR